MSSLTVSKPVAQTAQWVSSEEQDICKKLSPIFPESVSTIIAEYAVDIESCPICLRGIAYPVRLGCGHLFDLDCISDWFRQKNTCPLDRTTIDVGKIQYAEEVIKKVSAVFNFRFLHDAQVDPITVNVYSSVQRLKSLMSLSLSIRERNLIVAAFSPHARKHPREYSLVASRQSIAKKLYSDDATLTNETVKSGNVYTIYVITKLAQYGLPCDRCYRQPEKEQTCDHPDENEATADATIIG